MPTNEEAEADLAMLFASHRTLATFLANVTRQHVAERLKYGEMVDGVKASIREEVGLKSNDIAMNALISYGVDDQLDRILEVTGLTKENFHTARLVHD